MTDQAQTAERIPAECWHPSVFMQEEMDARGWTRDDLATEMRCPNWGVTRLSLDLYFEAGPVEPDMLLGDGEDFARAFGTSAEFWLNLEAAWRKHAKRMAS
jgi:plasmid maintenance system antidote protein VapI